MAGQMRGIIILFALLMAGAVPAAAQGQKFGDPVAYCRAAGTDDGPASPYGIGDVPTWMLVMYFTPQEIASFRESGRPFYGISWRCVRGDVLVCQNAQNPSCLKADTDRTPTAAMRKFCEEGQGSSPAIPRVVTGTARMLAYDWVCQGKVPAIAKETPLDAQGFVAADWKHAKAN